jgi:hypothetical protein
MTRKYLRESRKTSILVSKIGQAVLILSSPTMWIGKVAWTGALFGRPGRLPLVLLGIWSIHHHRHRRRPQKLHLALQNQSGGLFGITSVVWTIWHRVGSAFTALPQVTGTSAVLTPPANGQYLIHADVWAERVATVTNELSEFRGIVTGPAGATAVVVVWAGADMTKTFKLVAEAQASTPGGPLDLYNPVVELIS